MLTTGVADRPPCRSEYTSTLLPSFLVETTSRRPSGVKATCAGVLTNSGVAAGSKPRSRCQEGTAVRWPPACRKPCSEPPSRALSTYTNPPRAVMLTGKLPPEPTTSRRTRWSPTTAKTVMVSLPEFSAYSRCVDASYVKEPSDASWSATAPASVPPTPPVG